MGTNLHNNQRHILRSLATLSMTFILSSPASADPKLDALLSALKPTLFEPGVISTPEFEYGSSLSRNEAFFAFSKALAGFQQSKLFYSQKVNDEWQAPKLFPFSGTWHDSNPYYSKQDNRFYFTSDRPTGEQNMIGLNLWYVDIENNQFSEPKLVKGKINGMFSAVYPTLHSNKDIYFCTRKPGGKGDLDLYLSQWHENGYQEPIAIEELNTEHRDADPELSSDGKLLFYTTTKPGGLGHFDLHVAVKQDDGKWGTPINLGSKINSPAMDSDPILSPDENTLFFSSMKLSSDTRQTQEQFEQMHNGLMNIYRVDIRELSDYLKNNY